VTIAARHAPSHLPLAGTQPFASAEEAWIWTMMALVARRDGARVLAGRGLVSRPCEPDDVVKCLDRLYRQRRIDLQHVRILRIWGERGYAPNPRIASERGDHRLWREALDRRTTRSATRASWPARASPRRPPRRRCCPSRARARERLA
jgi:hypothetical protein